MFQNFRKAAAVFCTIAAFIMIGSGQAQAAALEPEVRVTSEYVVKIQAPEVSLHESAGENASQVGTLHQGAVCQVLSKTDTGWAEIKNGRDTGYIYVPGNAFFVEKTSQTVDETVQKRRKAVEYALEFVGGRYVYGGTDPNTGVDCSGFTRYVMAQAASVSLPHSSRGQASCGKEVSTEEMRPGDLLFYGRGSGINHVAMYIGDGQVVHASTEKTGIKTSPWDYRKPVKVVSLL